MPDLSAMLQAANQIRTLASWLESGSMAELLADVEFEAARASLTKARLAIDARSQVWNAIGQLETCYQALTRRVREHRWWHNSSFTRIARAEQAREKAVFVLCVMAVCYFYLGERKLCEQHLDKINDVPDLESSVLGIVAGVATAVTVAPFQAILYAAKEDGEQSFAVPTTQLENLRRVLLGSS